jgi:rhomboid protease GluP
VHAFGEQLQHAGALTPAAEWSKPWQFVSSMFLHAGLAHIALNLMALWFFHDTMKADFPKAVWLVVFLVGGIAGGALQLAFTTADCVGASGGIMAMWGAAFAASLRYRRLPEEDRPWQHDLSIDWMLKNIAIQFGLEFGLTWFGLANIGHGAHAGGFLAGMAIGFVAPLIEQPAVLVSRYKAFSLEQMTLVKTKGAKQLQGVATTHVSTLVFETTAAFNPDKDYMVVASKLRFLGKDRYCYHQVPAGGHLEFHPGLGERRAATSAKIAPAYQIESRYRGHDTKVEMIEVTQN